MKTIYDDVLIYDRDWEIIKEALSFLPEEERDAVLTAMVKMAVYN